MSSDLNGCNQQNNSCLSTNWQNKTQAFLGIVGSQKMNFSNYRLIVSPLCQVTWKKNNLKWAFK